MPCAVDSIRADRPTDHRPNDSCVSRRLFAISEQFRAISYDADARQYRSTEDALGYSETYLRRYYSSRLPVDCTLNATDVARLICSFYYIFAIIMITDEQVYEIYRSMFYSKTLTVIYSLVVTYIFVYLYVWVYICVCVCIFSLPRFGEIKWIWIWQRWGMWWCQCSKHWIRSLESQSRGRVLDSRPFHFMQRSRASRSHTCSAVTKYIIRYRQMAVVLAPWFF